MIVTAGATIEAIDPVRFISNHSSGKMGYAIAGALAARGADVDGHARVLRQCLQKFHGLADRKKSCSALRRWGSRPGRIKP